MLVVPAAPKVSVEDVEGQSKKLVTFGEFGHLGHSVTRSI